MELVKGGDRPAPPGRRRRARVDRRTTMDRRARAGRGRRPGHGAAASRDDLRPAGAISRGACAPLSRCCNQLGVWSGTRTRNRSIKSAVLYPNELSKPALQAGRNPLFSWTRRHTPRQSRAHRTEARIRTASGSRAGTFRIGASLRSAKAKRPRVRTRGRCVRRREGSGVTDPPGREDQSMAGRRSARANL